MPSKTQNLTREQAYALIQTHPANSPERRAAIATWQRIKNAGKPSKVRCAGGAA